MRGTVPFNLSPHLLSFGGSGASCLALHARVLLSALLHRPPIRLTPPLLLCVAQGIVQLVRAPRREARIVRAVLVENAREGSGRKCAAGISSSSSLMSSMRACERSTLHFPSMMLSAALNPR